MKTYMKKERIVGIDILKVVAAIMIVALHYCGYSDNLMAATAKSRELFYAANLLEAFCICGVNVFVIITCYIGINSNKTEIKSGILKATSVWAQTILITVPLAVVLLGLGIVDIHFGALRCFLPFSARSYWFVSTFICFSMILPLLNKSIQFLDNRTLTYLTLFLVTTYSVLPTFFEIFDWTEVDRGYTLVWFVTLYYCTAWILKSQLYKKISSRLSNCTYVACSLIVFASVVIIEKILGESENYIIRNYASIPVLLQSFSLFFCFLSIRSNNKKPNKLFSVLAQGSLMNYIIHMHPESKMLYSDISIEQHYPKTMTTEKCDGLMGD